MVKIGTLLFLLKCDYVIYGPALTYTNRGTCYVGSYSLNVVKIIGYINIDIPFDIKDLSKSS